MSTRDCLPLAGLLPPDPGCDKATYTKYVCEQVSGLTCDEVRDLCRHYACTVDLVVDHIVADKMGTAVRRRRRKGKGGLYGG